MKLVGKESIMKQVLILGDGKCADHVFERLYDFSGTAYRLHRLTDTGDGNYGTRIIDFAEKNDINEIVLAFEEKRKKLPVSVLLECKLSGISVRDPIEFLERELGLIDFDYLDIGWMVFSDGFHNDLIGTAFKRVLDITGSMLLLLISSPLFLLASIAIKLDSSNSGPIFYKQKRVGLHGRLFNVWKFRSMYTNAEADGKPKWAVENDSRVTAVGVWLRKYRIDELPQLLNVFKGEMSLVGPRPERPEFVSELKQKHVLYGDRHRVKPGLTGWAQMRFPYTASSDDSIKKLQYDMYYVKNRTLLLDILILLQTVEVVLCGKGAR